MLTINTILEEIKDVPINRLKKLFQYVSTLKSKTLPTESLRKKILSYGGSFKDLNNKDYTDFINYTKKSRAKMFDRKFKL